MPSGQPKSSISPFVYCHTLNFVSLWVRCLAQTGGATGRGRTSFFVASVQARHNEYLVRMPRVFSLDPD